MENTSNEYNIKAADYHFEADPMAVMTAADKRESGKTTQSNQ